MPERQRGRAVGLVIVLAAMLSGCDYWPPVESAIVETPAVELLGALADGETLGVRGGILVADGAVSGDGEDGVVTDDDRADGDFVPARGFTRQVEGVGDVLLVGGPMVGHGAKSIRSTGNVAAAANCHRGLRG